MRNKMIKSFYKYFENTSNDELLDIFSELELEFSVRVEYFCPKLKFGDDYESIGIYPEDKVDNKELMLRIDSLIKKSESFGYRRLSEKKLPWCLIEINYPDDFVSIMPRVIDGKWSMEDLSSYCNWDWKSLQKRKIFMEKRHDEPISEINIYFEK